MDNQMDNYQKTPYRGDADSSLPYLIVLRRINGYIQRIEENFTRFFESHEMFHAIRLGFFSVPDEAESAMEVDHIHRRRIYVVYIKIKN